MFRDEVQKSNSVMRIIITNAKIEVNLTKLRCKFHYLLTVLNSLKLHISKKYILSHLNVHNLSSHDRLIILAKLLTNLEPASANRFTKTICMTRARRRFGSTTDQKITAILYL